MLGFQRRLDDPINVLELFHIVFEIAYLDDRGRSDWTNVWFRLDCRLQSPHSCFELMPCLVFVAEVSRNNVQKKCGDPTGRKMLAMPEPRPSA